MHKLRDTVLFVSQTALGGGLVWEVVETVAAAVDGQDDSGWCQQRKDGRKGGRMGQVGLSICSWLEGEHSWETADLLHMHVMKSKVDSEMCDQHVHLQWFPGTSQMIPWPPCQ